MYSYPRLPVTSDSDEEYELLFSEWIQVDQLEESDKPYDQRKSGLPVWDSLGLKPEALESESLGNLDLLMPASLSPKVPAIHKLPPEMLSQIFEAVQEEQKYKVFNARRPCRLLTGWLAVIQVCSYWRDVAYASPLLWRAVDVDNSIEWLKRCILRSARVPLRIRFHDPARMRAAAHLLKKHVNRIERIHVFGNKAVRGLKLLRCLFSKKLPMLEGLQVDLDDETYCLAAKSSLDHMRFDPGDLPAIRTLTLQSICLPQAQPLPHCLHTLELRRIFIERTDLRLSEVLDALESFRSLERIVLYWVLPPSGLICDNVPASRFITWPNLRSAIFGCMGRYLLYSPDGNEVEGPEEMLPILTRIRFPESCDFDLQVDNECYSPYDDCLPKDLLCLPHLSNAVEAIWRGPDHFSCRTALAGPADHDDMDIYECALDDDKFPVRGQLTVNTDAEDRWTTEEITVEEENMALAEFCCLLKQAPLKKLAIAYGPTAPVIIDAFCAFPAITELTIGHGWAKKEEWKGVRTSLLGLAGRRESVLSPKMWLSEGSQKVDIPLKRLRILRMHDLFWYVGLIEDLERCLWFRREGGADFLQDLRLHVRFPNGLSIKCLSDREKVRLESLMKCFVNGPARISYDCELRQE